MRIDGERVRLRDWTEADLAAYESWIVPPEDGGEHAWQRTDGPFYPNFTAESAQRWLTVLRGHVEQADWPDPRETMVVADARDDRFIGQVSWYWTEKPTEDPGTGTHLLPLRSLGITIYSPEHWRGGWGTEALRLWIDHLFARSDSHRLDLETWTGNQGMCRVARKLGLTEEARFRRARKVAGQFHDRLFFGVLREEWQGPGGAGAASPPVPGDT
ncbi:GNAT family N-acetyltransferase [Kocuria flava]|uniref:GNAT family N-acetyltransferase n=1 Tax=Kocuria flava TaxID=446860 RepID=UPI003F1DC0A6